MSVEGEEDADGPSHACTGGSGRPTFASRRQRAASGDIALGARLAFEPRRTEESKPERCSQPKGDLFPLPLASELGLQGRSLPSSDALIRALNLLYMGLKPGLGQRRRVFEDR